MLLLAQIPPWVPLAALILLVVWVAFRRSFRRWTGESSQPPNAKSATRLQSSLPAKETPASAWKWEVQLMELSRALKGELHSKMVALNALTAAAKHERQRLEQAIAHARKLGVGPCEDALLTVEQLADECDEATCRRLEDLLKSTISRMEEGPVDDDRLQAIYSLHDSRIPSVEIARRLDLPLGDVELVLSLRSARDD